MGFKFKATLVLSLSFWGHAAISDDLRVIKEPTLCYVVIHDLNVASGCFTKPAQALAFKSDRVLYVENDYFKVASKLTPTQFKENMLEAEYPHIQSCVQDAVCKEQLPNEFEHFFSTPQLQYWRAEAWFDPETNAIGTQQIVLEPRTTLIRSKNGSYLFVAPSNHANEMYKYYIFN